MDELGESNLAESRVWRRRFLWLRALIDFCGFNGKFRGSSSLEEAFWLRADIWFVFFLGNQKGSYRLGVPEFETPA